MKRKDIKQFPLLTTKGRHFPHGLHERIVYSFLAYQDRIGQHPSKRQIARGTGLNGRTISKCLDALGDLVEEVDGGWKANRPSENQAEWFASRTMKGKLDHWSDGIARMKLLLPRKGAKADGKRFNLNCAAVYSELVSLAGKTDYVEDTSVAHLSKLLSGLDPQTVQRALDVLEKVNAIYVFRDGSRMNVRLHDLGAEHQHLFEPAKKPKDREAETTAAKPPRPNFTNPMHGEMYDYSLLHGIPHDVAKKIVVAASRAWDCDFAMFTAILDEAHQQNRKNVMDGKVNNTHCGDLLLWKLKERISRQEAAYGVADRTQPSDDDSEETEEKRAERQKREQKRREEMLADPLHPDRRHKGFTETDIVRRVEISRTEAAKLNYRLGREIHDQLEKKTSDRNRESIDVHNDVIALALNAVNAYYQQEKRASIEDFEEAIDSALVSFQLAPMFRVPDGKPQPDQQPEPERTGKVSTKPTCPSDLEPEVFEELMRLGEEWEGDS